MSIFSKVLAQAADTLVQMSVRGEEKYKKGVRKEGCSEGGLTQWGWGCGMKERDVLRNGSKQRQNNKKKRGLYQQMHNFLFMACTSLYKP
jgi:hypothetical protein